MHEITRDFERISPRIFDIWSLLFAHELKSRVMCNPAQRMAKRQAFTYGGKVYPCPCTCTFVHVCPFVHRFFLIKLICTNLV